MIPTSATTTTSRTDTSRTHTMAGTHTLARTHTMEHAVAVAAGADPVFALIADVRGWPQLFAPTVHVELPDDRPGEQLMRIWALAHGRVRGWTSRRVLDADRRTVGFQQVVPAAPVAAMGGQWSVTSVDGRTSQVVLRHDFRAVDDEPSATDRIAEAVERNSEAELAALRAAAEQGADREQLCLAFQDSVHIAGDADTAFAFLARAEHWPRRLPHVARLELTEEEAGIQHMEMDTRAPDGSVHTTSSVRICFFDQHKIVYKQLKLPPAMSAHTGRWTVGPEPGPAGGVRATSYHVVVLDPAGVREMLGDQTPLREARERVRHALGRNSLTTLQRAKQFAEGRE